MTIIKSTISILSILIMFCCASISQLSIGEQSDQLLKNDDMKIQYLIYLPEDYNKSKTDWPLMLFLHGAGERGDDINLVKFHGPPKLIEQGKQFPFIVVSPQCPEGIWWSTDTLDVLLREITKRYRVDENRIYLTGLSMGGYGTWSLAMEYPNRFAAIAPICGGGDTTKAHLLENIPIWVFHGAKDPVVPIQEAESMVNAVQNTDGNVKFTVYPEAGHDSWTETYNNPELYKWLLSNSKKRN